MSEKLNNLQVIKSINNNIIWSIKTDVPLKEEEINFIKNDKYITPSTRIYTTDTTCKTWMFPIQLPSGRYIEDIEVHCTYSYNEELDEETIEKMEINAISTIDSVRPLEDENQKYMYKMIDAIIG